MSAPITTDLIEQRVQHADAEDAARGEGQAEHEGQVGAVLTLPLWERGASASPVPRATAAQASDQGTRVCARTHADPRPVDPTMVPPELRSKCLGP